MGAEEIGKIFAAGGQLLNGKRTLAEAQGIDAEALDSLYAFCFHEYQAGKFEDAAKSFELLCLYNHENPNWWLALGSCRERLHDFPGAAAALYMALAYQGDGQGETRLRIAENLLASGDKTGAGEFAEQALAGDLDEACRRRAQALLDDSSTPA